VIVNRTLTASGGQEERANALIDLRSRDPATRNGPKQYPFTIELRLEERDWGIVNTS
jgi:hypothetical protein